MIPKYYLYYKLELNELNGSGKISNIYYWKIRGIKKIVLRNNPGYGTFRKTVVLGVSSKVMF